MSSLKEIIESAFENRAEITPTTVSAEVKTAILTAIKLLNSGEARIAKKLTVSG